MNGAKSLILLEAVLGYGGSLVIIERKNAGKLRAGTSPKDAPAFEGWTEIVVNTIPKTILPTILLLMLLLVAADVGFGAQAALLGAIIWGSTWIWLSGPLSGALNDLLKRVGA